MKKLVAVLSIAWLGAGVGAVYLWQQLDELRSRKSALQARVEMLDTLRQPAGVVISQPQVADTGATPVAAALPAAAAAAEALPPGMREMTRTMMRATLGQQYPDLEQELGLRPNEVDRFLDLLTNQRLNSGDKEKREADKAALAALLGNRTAQWEEYQQTLPARQQVSSLRGQLAASGSSLPEAQARPLMAALDKEMKLIQQEPRSISRPSPNRQEQFEVELQRETEKNRRLVQAARPHLNAQQLDSYQKQLDQQTELVRAMMQTVNTMQVGKPE